MYGSAKEFIENEFLLPYLKIGGKRSDFWELNPKTILVDFNAYAERQKEENDRAVQLAWVQGLYFRAAIASTPSPIGIAKGSLPKYPDMPNKEENYDDKAKDEEWVKAEKIRTWNFFAHLGKR